jgi:hypothetical protein
MLVAARMLYLRSAEPDRTRPFRTPLVPALPLLAIARATDGQVVTGHARAMNLVQWSS